MSEVRHLHLIGATSAARTEMLDGREHLVVPVICLVGDNIIHAVNAPAPEFVPASVISPQGWNGRPLVLGHPVRDGKQISANDPRVIEAQGFGFMSATHVKDKKLGTEAWMDVAKLEKLGQQKMLADARAGLPIEVSVGAYVQTRDVAGQKYKSEWATMSPDHLAFLPGGVGACSVAMGCGANRAAMRVLEDRLELLGGPGSGPHPGGHAGAAQAHEKAAQAHEQAARGQISKEEAHKATGDAMKASRAAGSSGMGSAQVALTHSANAVGMKVKTSNERLQNAHQFAADAHRTAAATHSRLSETRGLERSIIDPETLKALRDIPQSERDDMSSSDFAGPDESFPIKTQADVDAAAHLIGKAKDPDAVKAKIKAIAKRKGLTIPDAWQSRGAQMNEKIKALLAPLLKVLDGPEMVDGDEEDDPGEAAESVSYEAMRALIEQAKASLDEGSRHIDELIDQNGPGDDDCVEDAHLEALVAMCVQLYGTTNGIIKMATSCLAPDGATSPMAYMEQRNAAGARHNSKDQAIIQDTHDKMVSLGADCPSARFAEGNKLGIVDGDDDAAAGVSQFRAACGCGGMNMKRSESVQGILTLAAKAAGKSLEEYQKESGFTKEQVEGLNMLPEKSLEALHTLAAKSPADSIIQAKAAADAALAGHAHGLNAQDAADKAKQDKRDAAQKAKDAEAAGKDGKEDANDDEEKGKKMKAAEAAGFKTLEEHERHLFYEKNPEIKSLVERQKKQDDARKDELVGALKAAGGSLTEEQLKAKSLDELETLASFAKVAPVDYSGRGLPRAAEGANDVYTNPPSPYNEEALKRHRERSH